MADVHNKKTRSYNMSRIRSENTKPEMLVRKFLHAQGFRYSLYKKSLPGKPYIVLPKHKTIISVYAAGSGMDIPTAKILWRPKQGLNGG
jgi:DNA mismatch endonuclease (patch repair protein)